MIYVRADSTRNLHGFPTPAMKTDVSRCISHFSRHSLGHKSKLNYISRLQLRSGRFQFPLAPSCHLSNTLAEINLQSARGVIWKCTSENTSGHAVMDDSRHVF